MIPLRQDKRGEAVTATMWFKYMLAVILAGVAITLFTTLIINLERIGTQADPSVLSTIAQHRLLHSPDCFAHEDATTRRVYPGIIDKEKFTEERLQSCFAVTGARDYPCFQLKIEAEDQSPIGPIHTANYAGCAIRHDLIVRPKYILLQDGALRRQATLLIRYPNPQT